MDSLTQVVLGAAVGEAVLGKKIGNRAMLWGAIAGTVPDLDTLFLFSGGEVSEMLYHRGISHSIIFALLFSWVLAFIAQKYYHFGVHQQKWSKALVSILGAITMVLSAVSLIYVVSLLGASVSVIMAALLFGGVGFCLIYRLWINYFRADQPDINVSIFDWYKLFFWGLFTHAFLDAMTVYGTQLFLPFSDYRVAFNIISIVDVFYTLPFLLCVIIAAFAYRRSVTEIEQDIDANSFPSYGKRKWINGAGILLSSLYLVWTAYNKSNVDKAVQYTLETNDISYQRYMSSPLIASNFLWSVTIETKDKMYQGWYSILDKNKNIELVPIDKNHDLLEAKEDDLAINTVKWFMKDYYTIAKTKYGRLQLNDMRYGLEFSADPHVDDLYIMEHILEKNEEGYYELIETEEEETIGSEQQQFMEMWRRINRD